MATAKGKDPEGEDPEVTPGTKEDPIEKGKSHLTVSKTTTSTAPANGYKLGDSIEYRITVTNDGNLTVEDITLTDTVQGYSAEDITRSLDKKTLAPGETATATFTHVVTEKDVLAGSVKNVATAKGKDPEGEDPEVTPGTKEDPIEKGKAHLTVSKTTTSTAPANGYKLGDSIEYRITVTNDGDLTVEDITLTDTVQGYEAEDITRSLDKKTLAPGETATATFTHVVTEKDVLAGSVKNVATAKGKDTEGEDPEVTPGTKDDPVEEKKPGFTVTKTADKTSDVSEGDTIKYTITVVNTGNVTLDNIEIADSLVNFSDGGRLERPLAPGATATLSYDYTVTAADVAAGEIVNVATVTGSDPDNKTTTNEDEITVTTEDDNPGGGGNPADTDDDDDDDDNDNPGGGTTPGGGGNPGGGGAGTPAANPGAGPGAVTPADNPGAAIDDNPTPTVEPEVEIDEPETPLAQGTWALLNLLSAILTTLGAGVALFRKKEEDEDEEGQDGAKKPEGEEDDNRGKKMLASKIAGAVAGVAAPITFLLTEDMSNPMALTDKWTVLMAAMLAAQVVAAVLNKKASELDDNEEETEAAN